MRALIKFHFVTYIRSYRYLAPMLAYVGLIFFVYSMVPNPVMESYAFTSSWVFVCSAWLAYGFMGAEHPTQQLVTVIHTQRATAYFSSRLVFMALAGLVLGLLTTFYPIAAGKFNRQPGTWELIEALIAHMALSWLGTGCALFFTSRFAGGRQTSLPGLLVLLVLSLASGIASAHLPFGLAWLQWLLPPVYGIMNMLTHADVYSVGYSLALLGYSILYAAAIGTLYVYLASRRLF